MDSWAPTPPLISSAGPAATWHVIGDSGTWEAMRPGDMDVMCRSSAGGGDDVGLHLSTDDLPRVGGFYVETGSPDVLVNPRGWFLRRHSDTRWFVTDSLEGSSNGA